MGKFICILSTHVQPQSCFYATFVLLHLTLPQALFLTETHKIERLIPNGGRLCATQTCDHYRGRILEWVYPTLGLHLCYMFMQFVYTMCGKNGQ